MRMCLHINLKYVRTDIRTHTDGGTDYQEKIYIYVCEICKEEFEVVR